MSQSKNNFVILESFKELLDLGKWRYKVYYGGRGGAKSQNIARALLALGAMQTTRVLCARELQGSIADSVHKLLSDIISENEALQHHYTVQKATIIGRNGTEFIFKGLKHNATEIKSTEGVDICWIEEAEKVSDASWEVLIPTIRKPNSEIWVSFNPKNPTDPTYVRMVENADKRMFVKKVSWQDNKFFPDVLNEERIKLQKTDPTAYKHIWEGEFDERFHGFIYADILKTAKEESRLFAPHKQGVDVITAWDLGNADSTAIWFAQKIGLEVRIIDYYENNFQGLSHYAEYVKSKPYRYGDHFLPHDGRHERLGMAGSIKDQLSQMGIKCRTLPQATLESGINLTRDLLKTAYIDKEKCSDGLHALRNYQYEFDENRNMYKDKPKHDWASHGSDAMRYLAMALNNYQKQDHKVIDPFEYIGGGGYVG